MKQNLTVQNFGPIKEIDIDISNFLILIGEQATGKSTIAKLIYFFKSIRHDLIAYLYDETEIENEVDKDFIFRIRQKFTPNFFGTTKHMSAFKIKYHYGNNYYLEISLNTNNRVSIAFSDHKMFGKQGRNTYGKILDICYKIQNFRDEYFGKNTALISTRDYREIDFEKRKQIKIIETEINIFFNDDKDTFFIPAGRSILSTLSEQLQAIDTYDLDFLMKVFLQSIQRLKKGFNASLEEIIHDAKIERKNVPADKYLNFAISKINSILKGKYHFDKSGEKIFYDNDKFVKLNFASSGQQEVIWILLQLFSFILNKDKVFLVIEEPEAHLYPVAQKNVIELVTMFINLTNSQLIITTHSPYVMSSFNNLIYANNVGIRHRDEVSKIIQSEVWINYDGVSALKVLNGEVESLNDDELKLIKIEEIDYASAIINEEFDNLFNLEN